MNKWKVGIVCLMVSAQLAAQEKPAEPLPLFTDKDIIRFEKDPIAAFGHGSLMTDDGKLIKTTPKVVASLLRYYTDEVIALLNEEERESHQRLRKELQAIDTLRPQNAAQQLVLASALLDQLISRAELDDGGHLQGINNFLKGETGLVSDRYRVTLERFLPEIPPYVPLFVTVNSGTAYLNECSLAGVPTPPDWGDPAWTPTGSLTDSEEFISRGFVAKPYVYTDPDGVCIALPREALSDDITPPLTYSSGDEALLGIICQAETSGKACFWDNQRNDQGYGIPQLTGSQFVPIVDSDPADDPDIPNHPDGTDMDFAGGAELFGGNGGRCTACHTGENAFNLHPGTALAPNLGGSDTTPSVWHDPIVDARWPQNPGPGTLAAQPEASSCAGCHTGSSLGGRFPKLSWDFAGPSGYCAAVLKNAINISPANPGNTMPQGGVLNASDHADLVAVIDDFCDGDPALAEGDPHITTTDKVRYDFHGSGEFVLLKDYSDFEIQMRSRALATSFFPGPNTHTGVATCASSISALATRAGTDRITYQPGLSGVPDPSGMELRVNGSLVSIPSNGLTLASGGRITKVNDVLEIHYPDGEIMSVNPRYWSSQGHWNLNVSVIGAEANRGVMGRVQNGWLPALPSGSSLGPKPALTAQRHYQLNDVFANAWRVKSSDSLFDYAPGQSAADFTVPGWPKDNGPCEVPDINMAPPNVLGIARKACSLISDNARRENCEFDVALTGEADLATQFLRTERHEKSGTVTSIEFHSDKPKLDQPAFFSARVSLKRRGLKRTAKGGVQFFFNNKPMGKPVELDRRGFAFLRSPKLDAHEKSAYISATYIPAKEQGYLPSQSNALKAGWYK